MKNLALFWMVFGFSLGLLNAAHADLLCSTNSDHIVDQRSKLFNVKGIRVGNGKLTFAYPNKENDSLNLNLSSTSDDFKSVTIENVDEQSSVYYSVSRSNDGSWMLHESTSSAVLNYSFGTTATLSLKNCNQ